jgi:predicted transposase YdaD
LRDFFEKLAPRAEEVVMTAAEKLRAEGREEGREEGRAEGRERGKAELLLRQLPLRFGPLTKELQARVGDAGSDALDLWAERVLSASSIEDVFR